MSVVIYIRYECILVKRHDSKKSHSAWQSGTAYHTALVTTTWVQYPRIIYTDQTASEQILVANAWEGMPTSLSDLL
jgi:hypothetical protein